MSNQETIKDVAVTQELLTDLCGSLNSLRTAMQAGSQALGAAISVAKATEERTVRTQHEVTMQLEEFEQSTEQWKTEVLQNVASLVDQLESKVNELDSHWSSQISEIQSIIPKVAEGTSSIGRIESMTTAEFSDLSALSDKIAGQVQNDASGFQQLTGEAQSVLINTISSFNSEVQQAAQQHQQFLSSVESELRTKLDDTLSELTQAIETMFDSDIRSALEDAKSLFERLDEDFSSTIQEHSESFVETFQSDFDELKDHIGDDLTQRCQEAFEQLVQEAVQRLKEEVVQSMTTSQVGVQVTGAMAPIIPELVAAKLALNLIKNFL